MNHEQPFGPFAMGVFVFFGLMIVAFEGCAQVFGG